MIMQGPQRGKEGDTTSGYSTENEDSDALSGADMAEESLSSHLGVPFEVSYCFTGLEHDLKTQS